MTDWSVIFIKDWYMSTVMSLKLPSLNMMDVLLAAALLAVTTGGRILQIGDASWCIKSHIQDSQKLMLWQYQDRVRGGGS
jgi:hypothetical protein